MNLQQFILILKARYKIVLFALLVTMATALVVSLVLPKKYTANADVVVDVKSPDPVAGLILPALTQPGYMATQIDIISSRRVTQRVIKLLKLDSDPDTLQKWRDATQGRGDVVTWLSDQLQKKLKINPSKDSSVISLTVKDEDPDRAAGIANAFAQAYIDVNLELRVEPAIQNAEWFKDKAAARRDDLVKAQEKLSDYLQKRGIVIPTDSSLDYESKKMNELSTQLTLAQSQSADSFSKKMAGGPDTIFDVMISPVITNLKTEIARIEGMQQELAGNVGVNHPQYQRYASQIASLKQQLAEETQKINASVTTANRVSQLKEGELRAAIEAQKQKILHLTQEHDEVSVLLQEVEVAQKAYDAVSQRLNATNLESQSSQTNIAVLTPASVPIQASSPNLFLNLVLALGVGVLLGVGFALVLELTDRRVRSSSDMIDLVGLPVLGLITAFGNSPRKNFKLLPYGSNRPRGLTNAA